MGLAVIAILVFVAGSICGIVAVFHLSGLKRRIELLEQKVARVSRSHEETLRQAWREANPPASAIPTVEKPRQPEHTTAAQVPPRPVPPPTSAPVLEPVSPPAQEWTSLEVTIGAKWFNWVGVVLLIVGVMFFLKYAYDNEWIGPAGRLAIAAIAGTAALIVGEMFRRASYPVLFHTLTGGGLAVYYGCIYFSFQVYGLTGQSVSFALSVFVTAIAFLFALINNAPGICLVGQIGGFLSPVVLSTGDNRPIALFSFVTILNLATIACAYARNWRYVNAAGFIGTWALYLGWVAVHYDQSQIGIALFFSTIFYLTFLIAPMLHGLSRRQPLWAEDLWVVSIAIFVEFINNYALLSNGYRRWQGPVVVLQALTVSALYAPWRYRSIEDTRTRATLLLFTLALVTVAIPIQLRFYAIPIAWAIEGLMLGYVGQRYSSWPFQLASFGAIVLAAMGLLFRLPLHAGLFTPVFNRPFGSWATVIAITLALHIILSRNQQRLNDSLKETVPVIGILAFVLACALAHMEVTAFWSVRQDQLSRNVFLSHQYTSLVVLWAAIPLLCLLFGGRVRLSIPAAFAAYVMGIMVLMRNAVTGGWIIPEIPFFNLQWLSRLGLALSLWIGVSWMQSVRDKPDKWPGWTVFRRALETAGHVVLAVLLFVEVNSWISASSVFSPFMRFGFVSALWSLQALVLIGFGLTTGSQFRRILGFILFGTTVGKLLLVDMAILQPVYRVLSFAATGALLIAAAYLYQRFAKGLLDASRNSPSV